MNEVMANFSMLMGTGTMAESSIILALQAGWQALV